MNTETPPPAELPIREARAIHAAMSPEAQARTSLQNVLDVLYQLDRDAGQWPIVRVQVLSMHGGGARVGASLLFAPGLPPGDHDLYVSRTRPAASHEDTELLDYVLPIVANYRQQDDATEDGYDARPALLMGFALAGVTGRDAIRRAIAVDPNLKDPA